MTGNKVTGNIIGNSAGFTGNLSGDVAGTQSAGIEQIGKAMNHLDQSSQSNAASAEEIAATSGEINTLSEVNKKINGKFGSNDLGRKT